MIKADILYDGRSFIDLITYEIYYPKPGKRPIDFFRYECHNPEILYESDSGPKHLLCADSDQCFVNNLKCLKFRNRSLYHAFVILTENGNLNEQIYGEDDIIDKNVIDFELFHDSIIVLKKDRLILPDGLNFGASFTSPIPIIIKFNQSGQFVKILKTQTRLFLKDKHDIIYEIMINYLGKQSGIKEINPLIEFDEDDEGDDGDYHAGYKGSIARQDAKDPTIDGFKFNIIKTDIYNVEYYYLQYCVIWTSKYSALIESSDPNDNIIIRTPKVFVKNSSGVYAILSHGIVRYNYTIGKCETISSKNKIIYNVCLFFRFNMFESLCGRYGWGESVSTDIKFAWEL